MYTDSRSRAAEVALYGDVSAVRPGEEAFYGMNRLTNRQKWIIVGAACAVFIAVCVLVAVLQKPRDVKITYTGTGSGAGGAGNYEDAPAAGNSGDPAAAQSGGGKTVSKSSSGGSNKGGSENSGGKNKTDGGGKDGNSADAGKDSSKGASDKASAASSGKGGSAGNNNSSAGSGGNAAGGSATSQTPQTGLKTYPALKKGDPFAGSVLTAEQRAATAEKAEEMARKVKRGKTDLETARNLWSEMCEYWKSEIFVATGKNIEPISDEAYAFFFARENRKRKVTYLGMARAFQLVLYYMDIPASIVGYGEDPSGYGNPLCWLKLTMDGREGFIDPDITNESLGVINEAGYGKAPVE